MVITITNEFEELTSFGYIDEPITTNADGTFILGEDISSGRPVYYMQFLVMIAGMGTLHETMDHRKQK